MKDTITKKYNNIGITLLNFNIINISFQSSKIEDSKEATQILDQKIEEMEFIKNSKELQLKYLKDTNVIYDGVNKAVEITKGKVNKIIAAGRGKGKSKMFENLRTSIQNIQTATTNLDETFLFTYLSIFKNTFNENQNVYVTKNPY